MLGICGLAVSNALQPLRIAANRHNAVVRSRANLNQGILMRIHKSVLVIPLVLLAGTAAAQTLRFDSDRGFSFRFDRDDRRGDVEGKRASCEVYARIAVVQAIANRKFRCGYRGPSWTDDPARHFRWCRFVPRRRIAEEQRHRSRDLQECFDRLGDFDDDRWSR